MVTEGRISRFLALAVVTIVILSQAIFLGTATFAENREKENQKEIDIWGTAEYQIYNRQNIETLAKEYQVEPEYLYYIAEVEKIFNLQPYELFALIYQESKFIPQTKMDGGSLSYSTTQMKLTTAKTAFMAITEYYNKDISYPTHELLDQDKYYATFLAGGYLRYLHDVYKENKFESYTAYRWGIGGRLEYFEANGHYKSPYALQLTEVMNAFAEGKAKIV